MFQCIVLPRTYVNTKQWNVSNMKETYDICLLISSGCLLEGKGLLFQ
jgi:hypothetical protein